jgi:serine phosphatase RsbU (regulator of sigma subunit)
VADWCSVTLVGSGGTLQTAAVAHADPDKTALAWDMSRRRPPDPDAPVGAASVIRSGTTQVVEDVTEDMLAVLAGDPEDLETLRRLGLRHAVIAPIRTPLGVVGAFGFVFTDESGRRPGAADVELVESLASRAALHLENARLYAESAHIAQTLQTSLLPDVLPEIPGIELVARYRAAGSQNQVGGDFYDVFPSGDGTWTAVIGDVSGKGAEAAALTALARHSLHTAALLCDDPVANLKTLNRAMLSRAGTNGHFCTIAYVRVSPDAARRRAVVTVASGGHPPALISRADGTVEEVRGAHGPLIGIFRKVDFTPTQVVLEAGDLLLLYTDGIVELRGPEGVFGEELLREGLAAAAGRQAQDVVAAVSAAAVAAQPGEPRDDVALLALRVRP